MPYSQTALQTGYVKEESAYGTVPTFANGNAFRFIDLSGIGQFGNIERPDKTGTFSRTRAIKDNKGGTWRTSMSMAGNGAAGTAPDIGPFLKATFGKETVVASTSVAYDPDDTNPTLSIMMRDKPTSVSQLIAIGSIVQQMRVSLGSNMPTLEFEGICKWPLDSLEFGDTDTEGKGGLVSFPTEPAAPVTNGIPPRGRTGVITLDGNSFTTLRTATITLATGKSLSDPNWGSAYPGDPQSGVRTGNCDFEIYDDDSAACTQLKTKSLSGTPVDLSFQIGAIAGNIWTWLLKNVVLPKPEYQWTDVRRTLRFTGCQAAATSATSKDEMKLTLT